MGPREGGGTGASAKDCLVLPWYLPSREDSIWLGKHGSGRAVGGIQGCGMNSPLSEPQAESENFHQNQGQERYEAGP